MFYLKPEIKSSNMPEMLLDVTKQVAARKLKKIDDILKRGEIDGQDLANFGLN